ncbi:MAG: alanine racemase [Longimicrobiales bacterium]
MTITRRTFIGAAAATIAARPAQGFASYQPLSSVAAALEPLSTNVQVPADRFDPWIELDASAIAHNVGQITRLTGERPILAVLKNNAYGLGLQLVAKMLEPIAAIDGFAVVRADEAIALRDAGITKPVLLMALVATRDVTELVERDISLAIFADGDAARLAAAAGGRAPILAHFYVDTGMSRMGVPYHRALPIMQETQTNSAIRVVGTFTTLTEETDFDREQLERFTTLVAEATNAGVATGRQHVASSNGVYHVPEAHLDLVRPGIAIYGAYPSRPEEERAKAALRLACRLRARVVRTQLLRAGDTVGYGRRYVAAQPAWIATLPIGHADGYPGRASNGAKVLISSQLYGVIAVTASHTVIEVGAEERVRVGDTATLLGPDDPSIEPNTVATAIGVSAYDLLMHMREGLPRFILQG